MPVLFLPIFYAMLWGSIWFVSGEAFATKLYHDMLAGGVMNIVAANLLVFGLGLMCMFFGIPLRLLGVI